jgi:hypothetical protein
MKSRFAEWMTIAHSGHFQEVGVKDHHGVVRAALRENNPFHTTGFAHME